MRGSARSPCQPCQHRPHKPPLNRSLAAGLLGRTFAAQALETMRDTFVLNYPGVLLESIRLLSIVHHSLARSAHSLDSLAAPPQPEAVPGSHGSQNTQPLRTEAQLLSAALFDDTPEMAVQQGAVTAAWLNRVQKPFRNAWALCGAAHLHNLKAFDKKVAELCLQHFDQDLGLRSSNMQELLAADRKIENIISELYSQNWSLDDALYELTSVRGDLSSLLQPRPRVQKPLLPPNPFKGNGKGKGSQEKKRTADWESEHRYLSFAMPAGSDNASTEAEVNKLFSTAWPLSLFLRLVASWSHAHSVLLLVSHVSEKKNVWADELSRDRLERFKSKEGSPLQVQPF